MMSNPLPIVTVSPVGGLFERFEIVDDLGRVWDGARFVPRPASGKLYCCSHVAAYDAQAILHEAYGAAGLQRRVFVAPVYLDVYGGDFLHPAQIVQHMSNSVELNYNTEQHGNGPKGSLILPRIDWGHIEELKNDRSNANSG